MPENSFQNRFAGKRIAITGGSGYLAWNLVKALSSIECEVHRLSRKAELPRDFNGKARLIDHEIDVSTLVNWTPQIEGMDFVFHFAAQTSVYQANTSPAQDFQSNVVPLVNLLESCRRLGGQSPFVLLAGSATQFGIPDPGPVGEDRPDRPLSVYCLHKLMAEQYIELYSRLGWARGTCLRLANVYGPGPRSSSADRGILNQVMLKSLSGETVSIYGRGEQVRDYVYVEDVIQAFLAAASSSEATNGQHYVLSSGGGSSLNDAFRLVAERVRLKTGKSVDVQHVDPPSGSSPVELRNFVGNISKLKTATGWKPDFSFVQGIDRTLDYYLRG